VTVTNTGGAPSNGSPIEVTDELPEGLTLDPAPAFGQDTLSLSSKGVVCVFRTCTYTGVVVPDQTLIFTFPVDVAAGAPATVTNVVRVAGGGAPDASMATPTAISPKPAGFGISPGGATTALSSTQAGAHPDITTSIAFNTTDVNGALAGAVKDTIDELPPGFAGDLVDTPTCSVALFDREECPTDTQIGDTVLTLTEIANPSATKLEPVYNLAPSPGAVAKLGFSALAVFGVQGDVTVRPGDYGLSVSFDNVAESQAELDNVSLTVWGVPADPSHDPLRWIKTGEHGYEGHFGGSDSGVARLPFFTNPTSCTTSRLAATFTSDSWEEPEKNVSAPMPFGPLVGCDRLQMEPSVTVEATSDAAYTPTGLSVKMHVPQTYENADGLATPTLKKEVVTLPEGMTVNPSSGAGLGACTQAQFEEEATEYVEGHGCPNDSRIGSIKVVSPSVKEEAIGSVYIAQPYANKFGTLLALYVVARIKERGILLKLAGKVEANPVTGQLVTTFDDLPPLPFSLATFSFNQGANAPLVTPATCGEFSAAVQMTPYSNPEGAPPLEPLVPAFPIDANCPSGGVPPFNPQVTAGTVNNAAGSYSPFYLRLSRNDGEQEITGFSTQLPPGLTGNLSGVAECGEAEIAVARAQTGAQAETSPTCPAGSEIGHTIAEAGVGSVLAQTPGRLYLGGPFEGAPFSVVSVTSAKVGPFDLGTVVVHLPLRIDSRTAQVSIPSGPADQIPHIIKGIVVHLRAIRVYIDREHFMINPTSCERMSLSATVIGSGTDLSSPTGQVPVTVAEPFQEADCSSLKFEPKFEVSTQASDSFNQNGASLTAKVTEPNTPQGTQANIARVKVELPLALPSRLTTLQKACLASVFETNPAACPAASHIGYAVVHTPILPVPLEGPVVFVSHGGEAFPSLTIVLQGDGVTIDLVGSTFISKKGVTSTTFKAVPDQPFSTFQLTLPQGKYSALVATTNVCAPTATRTVKKRVTVKRHGKSVKVTKKVSQAVAAPLEMPTEMIGQNGAQIHERTKIRALGCPSAHAKAHRAAKKAGKGRKGRKK
ncbi:MAG TPA: hypothetical protein VMG80_00445, partial [Solirubrobacteraceae bacterium]|nr:hypothetical protein [Solirubrobacteraceae bacterium]